MQSDSVAVHGQGTQDTNIVRIPFRFLQTLNSMPFAAGLVTTTTGQDELLL